MKVLGIIPARYASTRFPGKPLVVIDGKSMIQRVYEQTKQCPDLGEVIIATDDKVIENHVNTFSGNVMMTSTGHRSGTDRCNEVAERLLADGLQWDIVVNIQGDEPFIDPRQISQVIGCFTDDKVQIATLKKKILNPEELINPDVVKVICDKQSRAIYFSRSAIPYFRGKEVKEWLSGQNYFKHIGLYAYRASVLAKITRLPVSSLEKAESLEQLRWIDHGYHIHVGETDYESIAIDSPADLLEITNRH